MGRRRYSNTGFFSKIALLAAVAAVVCAIVPMIQREQMSDTERLVEDVKSTVLDWKRHVVDDSKFTFGWNWPSAAMVCAVLAIVGGVVSLSESLFLSLIAIVVGAAVGVWQYLGNVV